ncbi:DUF542 domain-containing protein [Flaviaesturariibacter terrae]
MTMPVPTVSEIVRQDYRAADVFKKWGINYCCGGNRPLAEVCALQGIAIDTVLGELEAARRSRSLAPGISFNEWPVPFLIDYIQLLHHAYVRNNGAALGRQLHDFVQGHLKKYPQLTEVDEAYSQLLNELLAHISGEEEKVFPYIRQLCSAHSNPDAYGKLFMRTLGQTVAAEEADHGRIAPLLQRLRAVTQHYRFPDNACTNYQVLFHKLREFDDDLVQHLHLEQNVLFPRVGVMEKELRAL